MTDETTKGADVVKAADANKGERPGGSNTDPQAGNTAVHGDAKQSPDSSQGKTIKDVNLNDQTKHAESNADRKPGEVTRNDATSDKAVAEQHARHDQLMEKRNADNEAGHAKNMERLERDGEEAAHNARHHAPTKKQDNGNTPMHIDPATGAKTWGPPAVA